MDAENEMRKQLLESAQLMQHTTSLSRQMTDAAKLCVTSLQRGGKILLCGNGGSAADAQHIAAELVNRYKKNRKPLSAIALSTDTSTLTSIGNDFGFDFVFSKQVEAIGRGGDVLIVLSTSGNSPNILHAVKCAKEQGLATIGFTGQTGGKLLGMVDVLFNVPSTNTARIQEVHHVLYHVLCDQIETTLCPDS